MSETTLSTPPQKGRKDGSGTQAKPTADARDILLEQMQKEIAILRSIQDQGKLRQADKTLDGDTRKRVKLRLLPKVTKDGQVEDVLITSWDPMPRDEVRLVRGELIENQRLLLHLADGTTEEMSLGEYKDAYKVIDDLPVIKEEEREDGTYYHTELPDGTIDVRHVKFIN